MVLEAFYLVFVFRLQKIIRKLIFVILSFSVLSTCGESYANEANKITETLDVEDVYNRAQDASIKAASKLNEIAIGSGGVEKLADVLLGKDNVKHKAEELGNLPQEGEKLKEEVHAESPDVRCTIAGCNVANVMGSKAMHERESKLEAFGFKKDKDLFPEDGNGAIDKANYNAKKFSEKFDGIKGSYKDCKPSKNVNSYKQETECDEYYDVKYKNCPIAQVVEIDSKYIYQCTRKREDAIKTCYDEVTSMRCERGGDCDKAGIDLKSIDSDIGWAFEGGILTIGKLEYSRWEAYCGIFDKTITFNIKSKDKLTEFILSYVGFDDYMQLRINDNIVYAGPDKGATKAEIVKKANGFGITKSYVDYGTGVDSCERSTHWKFNPNINLIPYLKEGKNTIKMRVIVYHLGHGSFQIRAKQHCCKKWHISRATKCEYEGVK